MSQLQPQQQLSQIEKSVTHLLVATKQLLETLTLWSRGNASENEVSDVYVRLGYEFNIACRAFNAINVETSDLGPVPDLLRNILEETLSQTASQGALDQYLPRIRDIIINLLQGLKRKQAKLKQRKDVASSTRSGSSTALNPSEPDLNDPTRQSSTSARSSRRQESNDSTGGDGPDLPPRTSSVSNGRVTPSRHESATRNQNTRTANRETTQSDGSSISSSTAQNLPVIAPYPQEDTMPTAAPAPPPYVAPAEYSNPPPPPPPKAQDALLQLQRGGDLERRASRRFSTYQINKQLGGAGSGILPLPPSQNSPLPNRGRDARDSMNAVRTRSSVMHSRQRSAQPRAGFDPSPTRNNPNVSRISEEGSRSRSQSTKSLAEDGGEMDAMKPAELDAGTIPESPEKPVVGATVSGPMEEPAISEPYENGDTPTQPTPQQDVLPTRSPSRKTKAPSPTNYPQFVPEDSPQPGKEITLFLQYKSRIKKFVLEDGYNDLSVARLQLAFIEKFAWNTHSNGIDLPEIYIQDPVSGVRHELEDLNDIKDRSVLVLNIEALDEVKKHIDDGIGGLRSVMETIKTSIEDQGSALQRVQQGQQSAARDLAGIAAAPPPVASSRVSGLSGSSTPLRPKDAAAQLRDVQNLRRDLAVMRQTYSSFVSDIQASMSTIRTKAASVKSVALKTELPELEGDSGRAYVNAGKSSLQEDSGKIVDKVDDVQDAIEDLRKDVVTRGVRPLPRQLETVGKDLAAATADVKRMKEFMKREKPLWSKIWEQELQTVCDDRDLFTNSEELLIDLEKDLEEASSTFTLVEQATKQQMSEKDRNSASGQRSTSKTLHNALALDQAADPRKAKDDMLGQVKALEVKTEDRLEAIARAERARQKELESRKDGELFKRELGSFVEEGKLKKSGGVEEVERIRKLREERSRREVWERQNARAQARAEKEAIAAAAPVNEGEAGGEAGGENGLEVPPREEDSNSPEPVFVEAKEKVDGEGGAADAPT
ncbi:AIP3-domain-containing protein [Aulographum hederae CBS 113979]|uniref:AIP3-domain-containing protein n=1 Tax=Aulographum hederae CBS 113979 TaxID=1176131 RepID=A0A6G1H4F5_9PEZI|nr:AIP3-domain-containing protein [Aulographum hederae CBS 113979]